MRETTILSRLFCETNPVPGQGQRRLRAWVRLAAGGRYNRRSGRIIGPAYAAGATHISRIGGRVAVAPDVHEVNLAEPLCYLLKGVDDATAAALARHAGNVAGA